MTRVHNRGSVDATAIEVHLTDSLLNEGTVSADSISFYEGSLENDGSVVAGFFGVAFFPASYSIHNSGSMDLGDLHCARYFLNNGDLTCSYMNMFILYCSAGAVVTADMFVLGSLGVGADASLFVVDTLQVAQSGEDYGFVQCGQFVNGWSMGTASFQVFSEGVLQCGAFTNQANGSVLGPGTICISGHSENHGGISAPITICDITLEDVQPPYLDMNTGGFLQPITYCGNTACATVGLAEQEEASPVDTYPVPAADRVTIDLRDRPATALALLDSHGAVVRNVSGPLVGKVVLEREQLPAGVYLVRLLQPSGLGERSIRVLFSDH